MIYKRKRNYRPKDHQMKINLKRWRKQNPEKVLWTAAQQRARRTGVEFSITVEDIIIPKICPYLKQPLVFNTRYSPSIDRIENTKGYTKDNIEVISKKANIMKNDATTEELLEFAYTILERN